MAMKNRCAVIPIKACCPRTENIKSLLKRHPSTILSHYSCEFGIKKENSSELSLYPLFPLYTTKIEHTKYRFSYFYFSPFQFSNHKKTYSVLSVGFVFVIKNRVNHQNAGEKNLMQYSVQDRTKWSLGHRQLQECLSLRVL